MGALSRRRGFTLMEMLVVVGIIIVLTALSLPAISKFLDGQSMAQSGRITQSAFNEARRAAITQRALNYLVFFRTEDPSRPGSYLFGMQRYRERVGYEGEPQYLLPGVQFEMEQGGTGGTTISLATPTVGRLMGLKSVVFDGLPDPDNAELFGNDRKPIEVGQSANPGGPGWLVFRRDGTIQYNAPVLPIIPSTPNLLDLNTPVPLNQTTFDKIAGLADNKPDVELNIRETVDTRVDKRCFLDIDFNTGRVNFRVLEVVQ